MARRIPFGMGGAQGQRQGQTAGAGISMSQPPQGPQRPMPRRPPMTMAPAGNANPQAAPIAPAPPPAMPGGGPTSPLNIGSMLQTQRSSSGMPGAMGGSGGPMGMSGMGASPAPPSPPLPPWGDSQGSPMLKEDGGMGEAMGDMMGEGSAGAEAGPLGKDSAHGPSIMVLRLLRSLGRI